MLGARLRPLCFLAPAGKTWTRGSIRPQSPRSPCSPGGPWRLPLTRVPRPSCAFPTRRAARPGGEGRGTKDALWGHRQGRAQRGDSRAGHADEAAEAGARETRLVMQPGPRPARLPPTGLCGAHTRRLKGTWPKACRAALAGGGLGIGGFWTRHPPRPPAPLWLTPPTASGRCTPAWPRAPNQLPSHPHPTPTSPAWAQGPPGSCGCGLGSGCRPEERGGSSEGVAGP